MTPVAVETAAEQTFEFGPLHHSKPVWLPLLLGGWTSTGAAIRASAQAEPG